MEGKYIVEVKAYSKTYGMVATRKCFKGNKAESYGDAMRYAYKQAERNKEKDADFSVTIKGEGWRTAANVKTM